MLSLATSWKLLKLKLKLNKLKLNKNIVTTNYLIIELTSDKP